MTSFKKMIFALEVLRDQEGALSNLSLSFKRKSLLTLKNTVYCQYYCDSLPDEY
jgi:hypothetical protein